MATEEEIEEPVPAKRCTLDSEGFVDPESVREISIYMEMQRLTKVNTVEQTFDCALEIELSWPPTKEEYEQFQADPNNFKPDFIPNLTFRNAESYEIFPRPVAKSSTGYTIIHKGGTDSWGVPIDELTIPRAINYVFTVRGTFVETMELQKFPFDVQDLQVTIELCVHIGKAILVPSFDVGCHAVDVSESFNVVPEFTMFPPKVEFYSAIVDSPQYPFSTFNLRMKLARRYKTYCLSVIMFLGIISFSAISVFAIDQEDIPNRLAHLFTMMLTAVAFQFIVATSLPNIPYLTILDVYVMFAFVFIFGIALEVAILALGAPTETINDNALLISFLVWLFFNIFFIIYSTHARYVELRKLGWNKKIVDEIEGNEDDGFEVLQTDAWIDKHIKERMGTHWADTLDKKAND